MTVLRGARDQAGIGSDTDAQARDVRDHRETRLRTGTVGPGPALRPSAAPAVGCRRSMEDLFFRLYFREIALVYRLFWCNDFKEISKSTLKTKEIPVPSISHQERFVN